MRIMGTGSGCAKIVIVFEEVRILVTILLKPYQGSNHGRAGCDAEDVENGYNGGL